MRETFIILALLCLGKRSQMGPRCRESHYEMKEGSSFFCSDPIIAKRIISKRTEGGIRGNQIYQNKQVELEILEASILFEESVILISNHLNTAVNDIKRILFANERAQMSE